MPMYYSPAIEVLDGAGMEFAMLSVLPKDRADAFQLCVVNALDYLKKTPSGAELLAAVDASGHKVSIFAFDESQPIPTAGKNVTHARPRSTEAVLNSMILPFRGNSKNLNFQTRGNPDAYKDYKAQLNALGRRVKTAEATGTLKQVLQNIRQAATPYSEYQAIQMKTGIPIQKIMDVENGYARFSDNEYYSIAFAFYDQMIPGPGTDVSIRFSPSKKADPKYQDVLGNDALAILLGHELIHCWRKMCGRCVVQQGFEEEAMTVGIWKFPNLSFTENKLRVQMGKPLETKYVGTAIYSSEMAAGEMISQ